MDWFFFAALGILWAAFLLPSGGRRRSPTTSVEEFERKMELLEQTEQQSPGRWLLAPKKGEAFIGARERRRTRARERRRRAFTVLLEATGLSFLIGLFPPLRGMWFATGALAAILAAYCALLVHYREVEAAQRAGRARSRPTPVPAEPAPPVPTAPPTSRPLRPTREVYNGLGSLGEGDKVHVVVRVPEELQAVNA